MSLTKENIRAAKDRPRVLVPIEVWTPEGETFDPAKHGVWVGTMTGAQRDAWESYLASRKTKDEEGNLRNFRATLAIHSVQDEDGKPLFDASDIGWLSEKAADPLTLILDAAIKLNRLSKADQDELVKN